MKETEIEFKYLPKQSKEALKRSQWLVEYLASTLTPETDPNTAMEVARQGIAIRQFQQKLKSTFEFMGKLSK